MKSSQFGNMSKSNIQILILSILNCLSLYISLDNEWIYYMDIYPIHSIENLMPVVPYFNNSFISKINNKYNYILKYVEEINFCLESLL